MKEIQIPLTPLGKISLNNAFDLVFGKPTLERVHGPSLSLTEWIDDKRIVKFTINVDNIPKEVRRFFCGSTLRVTSRQTRMSPHSNVIRVDNRIKMHFLGAEFVSLKPVFTLTHDETCGFTSISGSVKHVARFPPPINAIVEGFMALNSQKELDHFQNVLVDTVKNRFT